MGAQDGLIFVFYCLVWIWCELGVSQSGWFIWFSQLSVFLLHWWRMEGKHCCQSRLLLIPVSLVLVVLHASYLAFLQGFAIKSLIPCSIYQVLCMCSIPKWYFVWSRGWPYALLMLLSASVGRQHMYHQKVRASAYQLVTHWLERRRWSGCGHSHLLVQVLVLVLGNSYCSRLNLRCCALLP